MSHKQHWRNTSVQVATGQTNISLMMRKGPIQTLHYLVSTLADIYLSSMPGDDEIATIHKLHAHLIPQIEKGCYDEETITRTL